MSDELPVAPDGSISPRRVELAGPQMRVEYRVEAQCLLPFAANNGRKPIVVTSKLYWLAICAAGLFA
jgi:hypothetical protein